MIHRTVHPPGSTTSRCREGIKTATSSGVLGHCRTEERSGLMAVLLSAERPDTLAAGPDGHWSLKGGQKAEFLLPGGRSRVAPRL
ncbi:MAG: hypothetical protein JWM59_3010 [Verrucomicrobiales bacterium]|nr:hypothetical protein [Verrucomicrobiales bacterium]